MGKEHIDDYFYSCRSKDLSPLAIGYEPHSNPGQFRLRVRDKMGATVTDFEDFDLEGVRKEVNSLARSLVAKGYEVKVAS